VQAMRGPSYAELFRGKNWEDDGARSARELIRRLACYYSVRGAAQTNSLELYKIMFSAYVHPPAHGIT